MLVKRFDISVFCYIICSNSSLVECSTRCMVYDVPELKNEMSPIRIRFCFCIYVCWHWHKCIHKVVCFLLLVLTDDVLEFKQYCKMENEK